VCVVTSCPLGIAGMTVSVYVFVCMCVCVSVFIFVYLWVVRSCLAGVAGMTAVLAVVVRARQNLRQSQTLNRWSVHALLLHISSTALSLVSIVIVFCSCSDWYRYNWNAISWVICLLLSGDIAKLVYVDIPATAQHLRTSGVVTYRKPLTCMVSEYPQYVL